jgi:hypothetical protein
MLYSHIFGQIGLTLVMKSFSLLSHLPNSLLFISVLNHALDLLIHCFCWLKDTQDIHCSVKLWNHWKVLCCAHCWISKCCLHQLISVDGL